VDFIFLNSCDVGDAARMGFPALHRSYRGLVQNRFVVSMWLFERV